MEVVVRTFLPEIGFRVLRVGVPSAELYPCRLGEGLLFITSTSPGLCYFLPPFAGFEV